jgi:hypothetical protein
MQGISDCGPSAGVSALVCLTDWVDMLAVLYSVGWRVSVPACIPLYPWMAWLAGAAAAVS